MPVMPHSCALSAHEWDSGVRLSLDVVWSSLDPQHRRVSRRLRSANHVRRDDDQQTGVIPLHILVGHCVQPRNLPQSRRSAERAALFLVHLAHHHHA